MLWMEGRCMTVKTTIEKTTIEKNSNLSKFDLRSYAVGSALKNNMQLNLGSTTATAGTNVFRSYFLRNCFETQHLELT